MFTRAALLLLTAVPFAALGAQTSTSGSSTVFRGEIQRGAWLRVRGLKGSIEVRETTGNTAVVYARRRFNPRASGDITFETRRDGANVTVCAIWEETRRCDANGYDSRGGRHDTMGLVDFVVELPKGIKLVAATGNGTVHVRNAGEEVNASSGNGEVSVLGAAGRVSASSGNGDIEVTGANGAVRASSGNGGIRVTTSRGPVSASTGNGRIEAQMTSLDSDGDMEFSSGNGSIVVTFPSNLSAMVEANIPAKNFTTDFPLELPARWNSNRIRGTIGQGGRRIRLSTGNGSVSIRKGR